MKKNIILFLFIAFISLIAHSQDQRTVDTKIADLMMNLPAKNAADHEKIMAQLSALGEPVIALVAKNLVPPGKGDDVNSRYVISGLVKYAAKGTNKDLKRHFSEAICKAIGTAKEDEVKDFLLQELQYVAGDEAVSVVSQYLMSQRLCDPACRVLARINTANSNQALTEVIQKVAPGQQASIAGALGITRFTPSSEKLKALTATNDLMLKKEVFHALAEIGDANSATLLSAEAEKAGFSYETTDAAGSYLLLLKRMAENGQKDAAEKSCLNLLENEKVPYHAKSAALKIFAGSAGATAVPRLIKALDSPDKSFRIAAQNLLKNYYTANLAAALVKKAKTTKSPELKAELITMLGDQKEKSTVRLMQSGLKSKDKIVKLASIPAIAKISGIEAVNPLIMAMKSGDTEIIRAAKSAILTIPGEGVAKASAAAMPKSTGVVKAALIEIIAHRKAVRYSDLIFTEANGTDQVSRLAAVKALQSVSNPGDENRIAQLLNKADAAEEIAALQDALFESVKIKGNNSARVDAIVDLMNRAGDKKILYCAVLAKAGGEKALEIVLDEFEKGNSDQKETALKAIAGWSDQSAMNALYQISTKNKDGKLHNMALDNFIAGINKSKNTSDQKVLMFRKAMELAVTDDQKNQILQGISRNSSLLSLLFVLQFLDNAALQQTAVQSVRSIVLNNNRLSGKTVENIVNKAISLNKDPEADYQKQALQKYLAGLPKEEGFVPMFNGKDLTGWKGLVENPITRSKMAPEVLAEKQKAADEIMRRDWKVENGVLVFEGKGYDNLCSQKMYGDFELVLDWRMQAKGDGGVYLRGSPQVQTWDTSRVDAGAQVGSGGLYNNKVNPSKPLLVADNPINEWNTFRITMIGEKVTVYLNGLLVVDNVTLENYWDRKIPIFDRESIELQAHGTRLEFRDIYVREIPRPRPFNVSTEEEKEGFYPLFNGLDLTGWTGNLTDYFPDNGEMVCDPARKGSGNIYTSKEYSNFIMRFEFQLTPGANNGLGIRAPLSGDAAYVGMELQILDNEAEIYKNLQPYQYHGSVYGVIPAKRGFQKPVGEWNYQEVQAVGNKIRVILNGEVIVDGDIAKASKNGKETADHKNHPGLLNKTGHIGFLGHGSYLKFRNLRIKEL